ncbi:siderophore-interacting protein [Herbaspirillum sp. YR522]|uniref:siderophore-interacting protein n=1 Tax=Herbaspirillum sp. YR522 TaxID=1144342 RepID=UPI00026FC562|nr:siderophore-interacting protein [Herbaspirillum sp. YR522]EJM95610.1 siderophore-interacting protein [Herbaspirillum sp. YR522]
MENTSPSTSREVRRVRHELKLREVTVARIRQTGTNMLSITFKGDALHDFVSLSYDDHIKFVFPDGNGESIRRDYTPTEHDPQRGELTLEFALHAEGAATDWARRATEGMPAVIAGPRGSMIVPDDYDWYVLAGDLSALPAITRRLKEIPAGTRVTAVIEIAHLGDMRQFDTRAELDVKWVANGDELLAAVRALDLSSGEGYVWGGGEAATMTRLRTVLLDEKQHPKGAMRVSAYWKPGASDFHEKLD